MRIKLLNMFPFLALVVFTSSCDRPECKNTNTTFNKFSPDTKEYKIELARQMQSKETKNLSYWFERYLIKGDKEFIIIRIKGDELCAIGEIQVNDWGKISGMRSQVSGYRGAELKGLKLETKEDSTGTTFIYRDIDRVID
jgi:hypothetical protein